MKGFAFVGLISVIGLCPVGGIGLYDLMEGPVAGGIEHQTTWGDISDDGSDVSKLEWRIALPFVQREAEVEYPRVSFH